jgi:hypothetical protein
VPTITRAAIQWMQDESESKDEQIAQLEEELQQALEDVRTLRLEITRLMSDRSVSWV